MRFLYEYRTSDNSRHGGSISAADAESAYAILKRRGIKPSRLEEAPGFLNKLLGRGKRWLAIAVLSAVAALSLTYAARERRSARIAIEESQVAMLPRHQIAGLPADWHCYVDLVFDDDVDRMLARYSQPGVLLAPCAAPSAGRSVASIEGAEWVSTLRQVVAGMREDASGFLKLGKSITDLETFLDERQRMEASYREQAVRQVKSGAMTKEDANATLVAVGLKAIE